MRIRGHRDLKVWQKAMDLVVDCYRMTSTFPTSERYGLVSQVRRAAVSVPSNIAEGKGRDHLGDYLRFLSVAKGSLMELDTQIEIAYRLGFMETADSHSVEQTASEVGKMLTTLMKRLKQKRMLSPTIDRR